LSVFFEIVLVGKNWGTMVSSSTL